jgi:hypothetical protein
MERCTGRLRRTGRRPYGHLRLIAATLKRMLREWFMAFSEKNYAALIWPLLVN